MKEKIEVTLKKIIFQKESFLIASFCDYSKKPAENITATGNVLNPQINMSYSISGTWVENQKYGRQFQIDSFEAVKPTDKNGIFKYLVRVCKFVGPAVANSLIENFGEKTIEILKTNPNEVSKAISGITLKRALEIQTVLNENERTEKLMIELEALLDVPGMMKSVAPKLIEMFKSNAAEIIIENPYALSRIRGVGFGLADRVALKNKYPRDHINRKKAACMHAINDIMSTTGNVWTDQKGLCDGIRVLIQVPLVIKGVDALVEDGVLAVRKCGKTLWYALSSLDEDETYISDKIFLMRGGF